MPSIGSSEHWDRVGKDRSVSIPKEPKYGWVPQKTSSGKKSGVINEETSGDLVNVVSPFVFAENS